MAQPGCWIMHFQLSASLGIVSRQGNFPLRKHILKINRPGEQPCPKTPAGLFCCPRDAGGAEGVRWNRQDTPRGAEERRCILSWSCLEIIYVHKDKLQVNKPRCSTQLARGVADVSWRW